ncbi:MAG: hypothetical protein KGN36_00005 [Acidobacteriota bacterium]|nr:hypothetical protein [Acidobacteriota bacterium]
MLTLSAAGFAADTRPVVLEGPRAEQKWTAKELELPADWRDYGFLVIEFRSSSPQRFQLRIYTADGVRNAGINPFAGAWVRAALPLGIFQGQSRQGMDMASVANRSRPGYYLNLQGPYGALNAVEAIGIAMQTPLGRQTFELRSVRLAKDSPGDAVLESKPLVDEFGQWMNSDRLSLPDLKREWARETATAKPGEFGYCRYGGYAQTKTRATGFFRTEKADGRWWLVDPDGHLFLSTGADSMRAANGTRTEGREQVFAALPPAELRQAGRGGSGGMIAFYPWNLLRRYGAEWQSRWAQAALDRMGAWGLNTIGNWGDPALFDLHRKAYVVQLSGLGMDGGWLGLPDVFSPEWAARVDAAIARQCDARKDDPWLLGYFLANEPPWPGNEPVIVDMILKAPETATQRELKTWLADQDTPARRRAFVYHAFEKYVAVIAGALKRHDPNHLNLGMRFGGDAPAEMVRTAKAWFDVFSLNNYDYAPNKERIERIYAQAGLPMLIGEFHFGVPGRGMSPGLRQVATQEERGVAYRYYMEHVAALPAMVGAHWFEWLDEPVTGRMDGENYNIGLVDVTDLPYEGMVSGMVETHRRLLDVHSGKEPATERRPRVQ